MFAPVVPNMVKPSGVFRAMFNSCRKSLAFISTTMNLQRAKMRAEIKFYSMGDGSLSPIEPTGIEISDEAIIAHMSLPYFDNPIEQTLYELKQCVEMIDERLTKLERKNGDGRR